MCYDIKEYEVSEVQLHTVLISFEDQGEYLLLLTGRIFKRYEPPSFSVDIRLTVWAPQLVWMIYFKE
jgi:hypothetical protein